MSYDGRLDHKLQLEHNSANKRRKFRCRLCALFPCERNRILTAIFASAFSRGQGRFRKCKCFQWNTAITPRTETMSYAMLTRADTSPSPPARGRAAARG